MAELVIAPPALMEYAESLRWYAEQSVRAAEGFEAEFDRVLSSIAKEPKRFPHADERHQYVLMKRYPFQVIYRHRNEEIQVIAVARASRRPGYWASR